MFPTSYDAQNSQLQQKPFSKASSAEVKTFHWLGVEEKSFIPAFRRQGQEDTTSQASLGNIRRPCFKDGNERGKRREGKRGGEKEDRKGEREKEGMGGMKIENEVWLIEK